MPGIEREPVGRWLDALAAAAPVPGGGAAAALATAAGAGLVEMVCGLAAGRAELGTTCAQAGAARAEALVLAGEDADAYEAVVVAHRLPRGTATEQAARGEALEAAMVGAAAPGVYTSRVAAHVLDLVEAVLPVAGTDAVPDLGVAAALAGAALEAAALNVAANREAIRDEGERARLAAALDRVDADRARAAGLVAAVRRRTIHPTSTATERSET